MGRVAAAGDGQVGLVEREKELAAVQALLGDVQAGNGGLLFLSGPAGIGKTKLLRAALATAREAGMTILSAVGTEFEREYPFGVLKQCLAPVLRRREERERLLTGVARMAAPAVLDAELPGGASSFSMLSGLYWLLAALAEERPLVLLIDDAHWADEPCMRFLGYLARRIDSLPVALIVASRSPVDFSAAPPALAAVRDHAGAHGGLLELRPLAPAGVAEVLAAARGQPVEESFARACHEVTGGNPFLLDELVSSLSGRDIPSAGVRASDVIDVSSPGIKRSVAATLARLSTDARMLAHAVAVLGDGTHLELAAELAEMTPQAAAAAVGQLVRAGMLGDEPQLRFRHPILGTAVRDTLLSQERAAAHARAAEILRVRGASPERLALQLLNVPAAADRRVVGELRLAARYARDHGAPATATRLLKRALDESPPAADRAEILIQLGRAELDEGRPHQAWDHFKEAHDCAEDPSVRGEAVALLASAVPTDPAARSQVIELAEKTLPELAERDRELALRLQANLVLDGKDPDQVDVQGDTPAEATLLGHMVFARMRPGARAEELSELARRGARQVDALVQEGAIGLGFTGIALALRWTDQLQSAEQVLGQAIEAAQRRGSTSDFAMAMTQRAGVRRRAARLRDAEADARVALAADIDEPLLFARGIAPLVGSLLDQGKVEAAAQELRAVLADDQDVMDSPPMTPVLLARMSVQAARREYEQALVTWREAVRRTVRRLGGLPASWIEDLAVVADVHHAAGDAAAARQAATHALELAESWGTPGARGQALHTQARVGGARDPIEALNEAVALLAQSPVRLEHARALVTLGGALRRRGARADSRQPLRDGYELALACGASGLAESARAELRASGVRLRREPRSGVDELTASEHRIAEMASTGLSNAEIAQELFLTVKTVEMHLTNTYRKLDISGRTELARVLFAKA